MAEGSTPWLIWPLSPARTPGVPCKSLTAAFVTTSSFPRGRSIWYVRGVLVPRVPTPEEYYDGPVIGRPADPADLANWEYGIGRRACEDVLPVGGMVRMDADRGELAIVEPCVGER